MRVTVERALSVSVRGVVAGQVPDDQALVAGSREKHVWAFCALASIFDIPHTAISYFSIEVAKLVTQPE